MGACVLPRVSIAVWERASSGMQKKSARKLGKTALHAHGKALAVEPVGESLHAVGKACIVRLIGAIGCAFPSPT